MYKKVFKRIFDILFSLTAIVIALPLWFIFSLCIWWEDKGPVYYVQERVGKDARRFKSIKFRSMKPDAERGVGPVAAKENDPRITKIGSFLRKTALDELPQLLNILKGDMSFVGPRALRPIETEPSVNSKAKPIFEIPGFKKRSSIRPGLTGAAQVFASRNLLREEKFKYDLWYTENITFYLDLKLIARSFLTTFRARWDT